MSDGAKTLANLKSSKSGEWYTPASHVELVRSVLGAIYLDPASSILANEVVGAEYIYTLDTGDLSYKSVEDGGFPWHGTVYCNPPYGGLAGKFAKKAIQEYAGGRASAVILCLSGYAYETRWFQPLWDYPICFVRGRVKFRQPVVADGGGFVEGTFKEAASTVGTVYIYLGPNVDKFRHVFEGIGAVR